MIDVTIRSIHVTEKNDLSVPLHKLLTRFKWL